MCRSYEDQRAEVNAEFCLLRIFSRRTADRPVQSSGANSQEVRHLNCFFSTTIRARVYDANRITANLVECAAPAACSISTMRKLARMAVGGFVPRDPG